MEMMEEEKMMTDNTLSMKDDMKDIMVAIKISNQAVKEASKGMSVEELEKLKKDIEEVKADIKDLNNEYFDPFFEVDEKELAEEAADEVPMDNKEVLKEEDDLNNLLAV